MGQSGGDRGLVHFGELVGQSALAVPRPTELEQRVGLDLVRKLASGLVARLLQCSFLYVGVVEVGEEARSQSWVEEVCRMQSVDGVEPLTLEVCHLVDVDYGVGMARCGPIQVVEEVVNCTSKVGSAGKVVSTLEMVAMRSLEQLGMGMVGEGLGEAIVAYVDVVIACMDSTALVFV